MDQKSRIHTPAEKNVTFPVEGREEGHGYLKKSEGAKFGVIVIQEWWGLNQNMVTMTDLFASKGFHAIAPDIYRGKVAQDMEQAGHLLNGLYWEGAVKDIAGASRLLQSLGCKKVGVTGFCMGGALAIAAISAFPDLIHASAPFYGVPDLNTFSLANIKGPIRGHFGETDAYKGFSAPEDGKRLEDEGAKYGKDVKVKVWPGAGHAFMNVDRPDAYNADVAAKALDEVAEFFNSTFSE